MSPRVPNPCRRPSPPSATDRRFFRRWYDHWYRSRTTLPAGRLALSFDHLPTICQKTNPLGFRHNNKQWEVSSCATSYPMSRWPPRSEEHTSETPVTNAHLVCRLLLEKKK